MSKKIKTANVNIGDSVKVLYTRNGLIENTYVTIKDNKKERHNGYKYTILVTTSAGIDIYAPTKQLDI